MRRKSRYWKALKTRRSTSVAYRDADRLSPAARPVREAAPVRSVPGAKEDCSSSRALGCALYYTVRFRIIRTERSGYVARLYRQGSAEPGGKTSSVVCQYRAQLRRHFPVDRVLQVDGRWYFESRRPPDLFGRPGLRRGAVLPVLLPRPGHAGHENRLSPLRHRQLHFRNQGRLPHARAPHGSVAGGVVRRGHLHCQRFHPESDQAAPPGRAACRSSSPA